MANHKLSKLLSASLAALSLTNPIISALPPQKTANTKKQPQTEENTQTTESTAWNHIKKHAIAYSVGAGATIGGLVWGAYKLLGNNNSQSQPPRVSSRPEEELTLNENDPIDPNDPITPVNPEECVRAISQARWLTGNQWFDRLCGDADLRDYLDHMNNYSQILG